MEATSNSPRLAVIIFRWLMGGEEYQKSGGQEVFVGGGRSRTMVASMEVQWSYGEVVGDRGHRCHWIGLIGGQRGTLSYEILSLTKPRGRCNLSVLVVEAKK